MTRWERSLRPAKSSGWLINGTLVVAVLAVGWIATRSLAPSEIAARTGVVMTAPAHTPADSSRPSDVVAPQVVQRRQRLTKCFGPQEVVAGYSDGACPTGTRASGLTVLPDINLADGMSQEARDASQSMNSKVTQQTLAHEQRVAMNVDRSSAECAQFDASVAALDAALHVNRNSRPSRIDFEFSAGMLGITGSSCDAREE